MKTRAPFSDERWRCRRSSGRSRHRSFRASLCALAGAVETIVYAKATGELAATGTRSRTTKWKSIEIVSVGSPLDICQRFSSISGRPGPRQRRRPRHSPQSRDSCAHAECTRARVGPFQGRRTALASSCSLPSSHSSDRQRAPVSVRPARGASVGIPRTSPGPDSRA